MEIKTSELEGAALDWAVAMSVGADPVLPPRSDISGFYVNSCPVCMLSSVPADGSRFRPSTDWSQGGALIEKYAVSVECTSASEQKEFRHWQATIENRAYALGSTPLVAAMRAIVAAEIGETVDIPEEIL